MVLAHNNKKRTRAGALSHVHAQSHDIKLMFFLTAPGKYDLIVHANCLNWKQCVLSGKTSFLKKNNNTISIWCLLKILPSMLTCIIRI